MCGIFAYIGSEPANIEKIKSLGMYNITRGSDACGIVINDKISKGVNDNANWSTFCENNTLRAVKEHENYIILGHTRQASVRATKDDIDCAHPIQVKTKKGVVKLIGVHNGTINNALSLSKKYNVKEGKIDSITLMNILADSKTNFNNHKVFEDYEGAATCLWYYPEEKNVLYLFKGATREKYYTKELKEERPLYMYKESESSIYFSSIKESLYFIGGDINSVTTVPLNQLIRIKIGEKPYIKLIKREKEEDNSTGYGYGQSAGYNNQVPFKSNVKPENKQLKVAKLHKLCFENYAFSRYNQFCKVSNNNQYVTIDNEPFILDQSKYGSKVTFWKGRYTRNGHILGRDKNTYETLKLDIYGFAEDKSELDKEDLFEYHFFQGFLFKSKEHAEAYFKRCEEDKKFMWRNDKLLNHDNLANYCYGVIVCPNDISGTACMRSNSNKYTGFYTGNFTPLFDYSRIYTFQSGYFVKAKVVDINLGTIEKVLTDFSEEGDFEKFPFKKQGSSIQHNTDKPSSNENEEKIDNLFQELISSFKALMNETETEDIVLYNKLNTLKRVLIKYKSESSTTKNPVMVGAETGLIYS